jgi:hypothetical protein
VAEAVKGWITGVGAATAFIENASPWENGYWENGYWENGYVESFNGKLRHWSRRSGRRSPFWRRLGPRR